MPDRSHFHHALIQVAKGLSTYIPGLYPLLSRKWTGGTCNARYCYSVWLRHLVLADERNLPANPKVVAELGPGDSIGIGLAALFTGSEKYFALDAVPYADLTCNLAVFDELLELFSRREPIPGPSEFPELNPVLSSYEFPGGILTSGRLMYCLDMRRLSAIRDAIRNPEKPNSMISYFAPWTDFYVVPEGELDMVFSQAVLEHVNDLSFLYAALFHWLKPGGFMSHRIDFRCHETASEWNGHWLYSDRVWSMIRGNRPFLINREPHSTHVRLIKENGFELVCDIPTRMPSHYLLCDFAPRFRGMTKEDRTTSGAFIQALKPVKPGTDIMPPSP